MGHIPGEAEWKFSLFHLPESGEQYVHRIGIGLKHMWCAKNWDTPEVYYVEVEL